MSSILKALKKLESEKASRKPDPFKIDSEILRGETRARISPFAIALAALLLFAGGVLATYLFLKREPVPVVSNLNTPPPVIPAERITPEAIVPALPVGKTKSKLDVHASPSASIPKKHTDQPRSIKPSGIEKKKSRPNPREQRPSAVAGQASAPVKPVQPLLRVTGIAFQDGVDSVAMINGVEVVKGSTIEGVRVVDIKRDRVVFDQKGENFEVGLGRSSR